MLVFQPQLSLSHSGKTLAAKGLRFKSPLASDCGLYSQKKGLFFHLPDQLIMEVSNGFSTFVIFLTFMHIMCKLPSSLRKLQLTAAAAVDLQPIDLSVH